MQGSRVPAPKAVSTRSQNNMNSFPCCSSRPEVNATTIDVEEDSSFSAPFFQQRLRHDEPIDSNQDREFGIDVDSASQRLQKGHLNDIDFPVDDARVIDEEWKARVELHMQAVESRMAEYQQMFDAINGKVSSIAAPASGCRFDPSPHLLLQPHHSDASEISPKVSEQSPRQSGDKNNNFAEQVSEEADMAERDTSISSMHELRADVLDKAEMYEASDSIWDMAFFIGLRYLGCGTSFVITCVYALNMVMQLWFCRIIWQYMLDGPVQSDFLDELLRYRVAVAHNADYADKLNMRSMASQICSEDEKLHLSGRQFGMRSDMDFFYNGAMPLCILTILCWIIKILGEASEATQFLRMVWSIRRSTQTTVLINLDAVEKSRKIVEHLEDSCKMDALTAPQAAALLQLHVVVRVVCLTYGRAICASLLIAAPRILIAILLGIVGVAYLSITSQMEELLLNGMALAFIADIDEILYLFFIPRRAKTFMGNLEPLPVLQLGRRIKAVWLTSFLKLLLILIASLLITLLVTFPFFDGLLQATDILCSGDTDFVFAQSKATGMIHATKTRDGGGWTASDYAVLQLARPSIHLASWDVSQLIHGALDSNITYAVIEPRAPSLVASGFSSESFEFVASLSTLPVADSSYLSCEDMTAGQSTEATLKQLQDVLRNNSVRGCRQDANVIRPLCSKLEMSKLRAICPQTCGCEQMFPMYVGFFAHAAWGCPSSCETIRSATAGYEQVVGFGRPCADTRPPVFYLTKAFTGTDNEIMFVWFSNYLRGMFEYLAQKPGFETQVRVNTRIAALVGIIPADLGEAVADNIITGRFIDDILGGYWGLMVGVPHPRHYEGCAFLTSPELSFVLDVQLCDDSGFASLRSVCPVSCNCGPMKTCPVECTRQEKNPPCADMQDGHYLEATVASLQWIVNNSELMNCPWEGPEAARISNLCHRRNMTTLREVCPLTCGCHVPGAQSIGFFSTPQFGCPASCASMQRAVVKLFAQTGSLLCSDAPADSLINPTTVSFPSIGPLDLSFHNWVNGFFDWYLGDVPGNKFWELQANLRILASGHVGTAVMQPDETFYYADRIIKGDMLAVILSGSWEILPGVAHPRGLEGCAYMTSHEVLILYGIDFCDVGKFTSLRPLCPVSCGCHDAMPECPTNCTS